MTRFRIAAAIGGGLLAAGCGVAGPSGGPPGVPARQPVAVTRPAVGSVAVPRLRCLVVPEAQADDPLPTPGSCPTAGGRGGGRPGH